MSLRIFRFFSEIRIFLLFSGVEIKHLFFFAFGVLTGMEASDRHGT